MASNLIVARGGVEHVPPISLAFWRWTVVVLILLPFTFSFLIKNSKIIKKEFKEKLKTDTAFAKSPEKQLDYIYKKTDHYESAHLRLPIFKIFK